MINALRDMTDRLTAGNLCLASPGLAASGADALTATAVTLTIDGLFKAFGVQAAIDISALPAYSNDGLPISPATPCPPAHTAKYVLAANMSSAIVLLCGTPLPNDNPDTADWPPLIAGYAPIGGIKVVNTGSAPYVPGTTAFNAAGIAATFLNFMTIPPRSV